MSGTTTNENGAPVALTPVPGSLTQSPQIWPVPVLSATPVSEPSSGIVSPSPVGDLPARARTIAVPPDGCETTAPQEPSTEHAVSASSRKMTSGSGGAQ